MYTVTIRARYRVNEINTSNISVPAVYFGLIQPSTTCLLFSQSPPCLSSDHTPWANIRGDQGSEIILVRSYLPVPQAAGQVKILIVLLNFFLMYANILRCRASAYSKIFRGLEISQCSLIWSLS